MVREGIWFDMLWFVLSMVIGLLVFRVSTNRFVVYGSMVLFSICTFVGYVYPILSGTGYEFFRVHAIFDLVMGSFLIGVVLVGFVMAVCHGLCLWAMYRLLVRKRSDQSLSVKSESANNSGSDRFKE